MSSNRNAKPWGWWVKEEYKTEEAIKAQQAADPLWVCAPPWESPDLWDDTLVPNDDGCDQRFGYWDKVLARTWTEIYINDPELKILDLTLDADGPNGEPMHLSQYLAEKCFEATGHTKEALENSNGWTHIQEFVDHPSIVKKRGKQEVRHEPATSNCRSCLRDGRGKYLCTCSAGDCHRNETFQRIGN